MEGEHLDSAVTHFQEAIQLDEQSWTAYEGLARCAGGRENWNDAISWQKKAVEAAKDASPSVRGQLWPRLAEWYNEVDDKINAQAAAQNGFDADPFSLTAQDQLFTALHEKGDTKGLIEKLRYLDSEMFGNYSQLVRFFVKGYTAYTAIGGASRKEGKPQFVIDAMQRAVEIAEEEEQYDTSLDLDLTIGNFKWVFNGDYVGALDNYKSYLAKLDKENEDCKNDRADEKRQAMNSLAQFYFDTAAEAFDKDTAKSTANANELKKLAVVVTTGFHNFEGFDLYRQDYPATLWGRWLKDYRKVNESVWKKCFRTRILEELKSLDDADSTNDTDGLCSLALSLLHAGDRKNAGAILAILFKKFEEPEPEPVPESEVKDTETKTQDANKDDKDGNQNGDGQGLGGVQPDAKMDENTETLEHINETHPDLKSGESVPAEDNSKVVLPATSTIEKELQKLNIEENANAAENTTNSEMKPKEVVESTQADDQTKQHSAIKEVESAQAVGQPEQDSKKDVESTQAKQVTVPAKDTAAESIPPTDPAAAAHELRLDVKSTEWWCDDCRRKPREVKEMYFCEFCDNVNWCGDCLPLLHDPAKRDTLNFDFCHPAHQFYRAWPIPEEARYVAAETFEGGVTMRRGWLENLRKEWWE
jgi:tetratricopeptide (TPR) repeat protein